MNMFILIIVHSEPDSPQYYHYWGSAFVRPIARPVVISVVICGFSPLWKLRLSIELVEAPYPLPVFSTNRTNLQGELLLLASFGAPVFCAELFRQRWETVFGRCFSTSMSTN